MALESPTAWLTNFVGGFTGQRPVFSNGAQIGYYKPAGNGLNELCNGTVFLYAGQAQTDPKTWTTKDDLWRDVSVTQWCLKWNVAPSWLDATQKAAIVQKPTGGFTVPGINDQGATALAANMPLIIGGSVAGLGLLLLLLRR